MRTKLRKKTASDKSAIPSKSAPGSAGPLILPEGILPSRRQAGWTVEGAPSAFEIARLWMGFLSTAARVAASVGWEGACNAVSLSLFLFSRARWRRTFRELIASRQIPAPAAAVSSAHPRLRSAAARALLLAALALAGLSGGCKAIEPLRWSLVTLSGVDELDHAGRELRYDAEVFLDPELKKPGLIETFSMIGWY